MRTPPKNALWATAGLLLAVAVGWVAVISLDPTPALPDTVPADRFSAERAMRHVERLAAAPRPGGTPAHRAAREYLLSELGALGMRTEVQSTTVVQTRPGGRVLAARVENVLARLEGSDSGGAVLLMAHYDSRPRTLGAGDDASGVAIILETLRAMGGDPPPLNDLIVLLTDGEELGLLGARAFADEHPWADEVAVVLNFEARGNAGPATMFETGPSNLALVRTLAAAPRPLANSLSYEIYRRMPNDTDFTVFRELGLAGLNFAFIHGHPAYHSMLDTPDRLSAASVQHLGSQALAVTRRLTGEPLPPAGDADGVFFNLLDRWLVVYPAGWAVWVFGLAALLSVGAVVSGVRSGSTTLSGVARGVWVALLSLVGAAIVGWLLWWAIERFFPHLLATPHRVPYDTSRLGMALASLVAAWSALLAFWQRDRIGPLELAAGALGAWLLLAAASTFGMAGGSFLFVWPAIALALATIAAAAWSYDGLPEVRGVTVLSLAALPPMLLLAPVAALITVALTLRLSVAVAVVMALPALSLLPLARLAQPGARPWLAIGLGGVGAALLVVSVAGFDYDRERPRVDTLLYLLDAGEGESRWISPDERPDAWTAQLLGSEPERIEPPFTALGDEPVMAAPAPLADLAPPRLEVLSDVRRGGRQDRTVEVRIRSPRGAPAIRIEAESSVPIRLVSVDGRPVEVAEGDEGSDGFEDALEIDYLAAPEEGIRLVFEVPGRWPVEAKLVDQSYGFPELDPPLRERPRELMSSISWRTDSTAVMKTVFF